jgi:hypothetical protein
MLNAGTRGRSRDGYVIAGLPDVTRPGFSKRLVTQHLAPGSKMDGGIDAAAGMQ